MRSDEIPGWCILTAQFLIHFEKNKSTYPYGEIHRDFLDTVISEPKLNDFYYANPGLILMLCYGLLVYPLEFWKNIKSDSLTDIEEEIIFTSTSLHGNPINSLFDLFEFKPSHNFDNYDQLFNFLRNSIAHADVICNQKGEIYTFKDSRNKNTNSPEVTISTENLGILLSGVGKYFYNNR